MPTFIDRRADSKGRSAVNRERFVRRYKQHIREATDRMVSERSIRDMEKGGVIDIPARDISEPTFRHKPGDGDIDRVLPGNKHFSEGDSVPRPEGGGGGSGSGNHGQGDSADSFQFVLSREEFMKLFFDGLELPRLARSQLGETMSIRTRRAGYTHYGTPANLSLQRTMKMALARRLVLNSACDREEAALRAQREEIHADDDSDRLSALDDALQLIHHRRGAIHFLEDIDLRYRARVPLIEPSIRAVMFCLMDVSTSMDEHKKDLAKRFFTLLYLFLTRKYAHVDVVFLRHADDAEEVDEETFFHDTKSGGTVVLSALTLMAKVLKQRYADRSWNVYGAQISDGDAFGKDPEEASQFLKQHLLSLTRYFTYVEAGSNSDSRATPLWASYESIKDGRLAMRRVAQRGDVYPALASLFEKQEAAA